MRHCLTCLVIALIVAGCESHSDIRVGTTDRGAHHWQYYYRANVYYCYDHKHYWHYLPSERKWVETDQLERHIDTSYKPYTVINESSNYPYQNHRTHVEEARKQEARLQ